MQNAECQSCRFKDYRAGMNECCAECWTRYVLGLIEVAGKRVGDPDKVRDRVIEELSKEQA